MERKSDRGQAPWRQGQPEAAFWRWIDRALPAEVRAGVEATLRARLFLSVCVGLTLVGLFFAQQIYAAGGQTVGVSFTVLFLLVGAALATANIAFAWSLKRLTLPAILLALENVLIVQVVGFFGSGIIDTSQWWVLPAPLFATFMVGPAAGIGVSLFAAVGDIVLFFAPRFGVVYAPIDDTSAYFGLLASLTVLAMMAGIGFMYEASRRRGLAIADAAAQQLRAQNAEMERVNAELVARREGAELDAKSKTEFLERMRTFGMRQEEALERTRGATAKLAETVKAIAASVDTLAGSAASTDANVAGMADGAQQVQSSATALVHGVEETNKALRALVAVVTQLQSQVDAAARGAEQASRAMLAVEESATQVVAGAASTATLSEQMRDNAARGQEAVRRTLDGVDEIRQSGRSVGAAIRALGEKVEAIGAMNLVIDEVAVETNVLALNAAIIAAQAGAQGAGFSVVAGQIKALADRTARSTKEIAAAIQAVREEAHSAVAAISLGETAMDAGVDVSKQAARALDEIVASADKATAQARAIEGVTGAQATRARTVAAAMAEVNELVLAAARATADHSRAASSIEAALARLRALAPELQGRSRTQAEEAGLARAALSRVRDMAQRLAAVQGEQSRASEETLRAVEEIQRAQRGQGDALQALIR